MPGAKWLNQQILSPRAVAFPSDRIRSLFPALLNQDPGFIFFDNAAGAQIPQVVFDARSTAICCIALCSAAAAMPRAWKSTRRSHAHARVWLTSSMHRDPNEIAFGMNATTFLRLLSLAIGRTLLTRNEIVVTELDHEANIATWLQLEREGAKIHSWKMREDNNLHVEDLAPLLTSKTRLVACTVTSHALGSIVDVATVSKLAHAAGAEVALDCVHYSPSCAHRCAGLRLRLPRLLRVQGVRSAHGLHVGTPRTSLQTPDLPRGLHL